MRTLQLRSRSAKVSKDGFVRIGVPTVAPLLHPAEHRQEKDSADKEDCKPRRHLGLRDGSVEHGVQLRSSIACAGFVSCNALFDGLTPQRCISTRFRRPSGPATSSGPVDGRTRAHQGDTTVKDGMTHDVHLTLIVHWAKDAKGFSAKNADGPHQRKPSRDSGGLRRGTDLRDQVGLARGPSNTADQLRGPRRPLAIADLVSCIRLLGGLIARLERRDSATLLQAP